MRAMEEPGVQPVVTVFRSRLRPGVEEEFHLLAARIEARARATPGFVDFKTFTAPDGERVSVVVFDSPRSHDAWRDDPEHRAAQELGRERFYAEYDITVADQRRRRRFGAAGD
jgi:heme-degrading monooxygenase HmoA